MIRAPRFWQEDSALARMLAVAAPITARLTARRLARPGFDPGIPVICCGNAGVGGAGKTVLARYLLDRMAGRGATPFGLSRGHGGRLTGPVQVDPSHHMADDVGDEALLLAATAPTIISRDRAAGARLARDLGAGAIVMDDGLQNPDPIKTVSLLVVDGGAGFGNGRLLPAGPLREPIAAAASRCAAAVLIGEDRVGARAALPAGLPVIAARIAATASIPLAGRRVTGFAGIGRPEKFFETLRDLGADLADGIGFADHHRYRQTDLDRLAARAAADGSILATTEKDAVKLPDEFRARVAVVAVTLRPDDPDALERLLP